MPQAIASRYARALADAALDPKNRMDASKVLAELTGFDELLHGTSELRNILLSPAVQANKKKTVVSRLAAILSLSRLVRNFLCVLIDHRRIAMVSEVREAFEAVIDERLGLVRADVRSAIPLKTEQQQAIQAEFARLTGKQVRCSFGIDPALVGGVVARIGSTVYDGSVRARLNAMRARLVAR